MTRQLSMEECDRLLARTPPWLASALGAMASVLTMLAIFGFLYLTFVASGLFQLLGELAHQSVEGQPTYGMGLWRALGITLLQSTLNIAASLWSVRWAFLGLGMLGCLAGLATRRVVRLSPRLGGAGSFLFFLLSFLYVIVPGIFFLVSGSEALLEMMGVNLAQALFSSLIIELLVGTFFALMLSTLMWELWRLSYAQLLSWALPFAPRLQAALRQSNQGPDVSTGVMDDYRSYTARLRELKRDEEALEQAQWRRPTSGQVHAPTPGPTAIDESTSAAAPPIPEAEPSVAELLVRPLTRAVLPALVILPLCLAGVRILRPYQMHVRAYTVENWTITVSADRTRTIAPVEITYRPHILTIHKLTGGSMVTIVLTGPEPSQEEVWSLREWDLSDHPFTREVPIDHLSPGRYELTFQFEGPSRTDEQYAGLGYTYSQGGGLLAQRLGLAAGLLLATAFVAAGTILAAVVLRLYIIIQRSQVLSI